MPNSAKRKVAAGAVGLAVLVGTGGAYAAAQTSTPTPSPTPAKSKVKVDLGAEQKAFLDDVADWNADGVRQKTSGFFRMVTTRNH